MQTMHISALQQFGVEETGLKIFLANFHYMFLKPLEHMGREHASREKKLPMVIFLIFVHKNVYIIRVQKIKIRPLKGFEKKARTYY